MNPPYFRQFDVTGTMLGVSGPLKVASWIFPADGDVRGVWFCLPGGSYTKAYYHLGVPGYPPASYSFALHMAQQGFIVIAVDHLGTGESTPEQQDQLFTNEIIVAANNEVLRQVEVGMMTETLHPALSAFSGPLPIFGLGHSWGGNLLLMQEDAYHSFDAIGVLGWSNRQISLAGSETKLAQAAGVQSRESPEETRQTATRLSPQGSRVAMHDFFFAADVPAKVIAADDALATSFPEGVLQEDSDPTLMQPIAAKIRIPVFLCLASLVDVSMDLGQEAATYPPGLVFSYALPGSHHCHNFASTRYLLWTLLEDWAQGILRQYSY